MLVSQSDLPLISGIYSLRVPITQCFNINRVDKALEANGNLRLRRRTIRPVELVHQYITPQTLRQILIPLDLRKVEHIRERSRDAVPRWKIL